MFRVFNPLLEPFLPQVARDILAKVCLNATSHGSVSKSCENLHVLWAEEEKKTTEQRTVSKKKVWRSGEGPRCSQEPERPPPDRRLGRLKEQVSCHTWFSNAMPHLLIFWETELRIKADVSTYVRPHYFWILKKKKVRWSLISRLLLLSYYMFWRPNGLDTVQ